MTPTFTVLITTCNRLKFLPRSIECVRKQTVPAEIVVVDDNSRDGSEAYLRGLADEGVIVYHRNDPGMGQSASINLGVRLAKGDWIKHLDDDDYMAEDCLERFGKVLALKPEAAIAACRMIDVDTEEREVLRPPLMGIAPAYYIPQEDLHYAMLSELVPFGPTSQVAVKRQAYLNGEGWQPRFCVFNDSDAWSKAAREGDAVFLDEYLVYHTTWEQSIDKRTSLSVHLSNLLEVKEIIYHAIRPKHRAGLPSLKTVQDALRLHWCLTAWKHGKIREGLNYAAPALTSPAAWAFFLRVRSAVSRGALADYAKPLAAS